ncbi:hypothetical protein V6Z12_A06G201400 [Gossypium hirsutum]
MRIRNIPWRNKFSIFFTRNIPWCYWQSKAMKLSKLTAMDAGNCFQLHASLVFIAIITFTSNVQRPLEIPNYPLHPEHSNQGFFLRQRPHYDNDLVYGCVLYKEKRNIDSDYLCNLCQKQHSGPFYGCSLCHFNINVECAWPRSIVEDKSSHQHPFSLLWRQGSFICDACDTEGNYISYICLKCCIEVHKKCTSLPRIIKFSRHDHCIFHKHFLQTRELTRQDCKICFNKVKLDRGSYSCGKPGCNYVVHVNCVLENEKLYEVIEDEKQYEEFYEKSMQSSIIRVIEVNEVGEATKIQHFTHQYYLGLADKMEEIDRKCDGCMLSISTLFHYCSECPFFLHKTCVELPRIKQHWFRQANATLFFKDFQNCDFCDQSCSGFFYEIDEWWDMCIRCDKVVDIIECEGHQHFLFYDFNYEKECNGCGVENNNGAFRCGECRFALDFGCLTLPHSTLHKIDEHMLNLTYHDDKEQSYCDICERERDPRLYCGKLCQEEILKCEESTCDYIIHCKCLN